MNKRRIGAVAAASAVAAAALTASPAYAESPPGCAGTVQIGSTAYLTVGWVSTSVRC